MVNQYVVQRMEGMLAHLRANHVSLAGSASAVKGAGRADFINKYLEKVIPTNLRISTNGEVTDQYGSITGELDIIIENGFLPSLPISNENSARLFFAEGVAAVIEVKSNLKSQWDDVLSTGRRLASIERKVAGGTYGNHSSPTVVMVPGMRLPANATLGKKMVQPTDEIVNHIPYFVVGYTGWSTTETIASKLDEAFGIVSGILQIDAAYFAAGPAYRSVRAPGSLSLLAFIDAVQVASTFVRSTSVDLLAYGM